MMRHVFLAALMLFLAFGPSLAEPPPCSGRDLLEELRIARPDLHAEVLAEASTVRNSEALLWRIEREGTTTSWLLGTAHVTDPRVTGRIPAMEEAFENSRTLALELEELRDPQTMAMAAFRHAHLLVLPSGQSLWDLIPDDQEAAIRANPNLPPGAEASLFGYQPWVVAGMLSVPLCEYARKQSGIETFDVVLARRAAARQMPVVGLETMEEQLSVFATMPQELQVKYLLAVARMGHRAADHFETLIRLYEQRRITALVPLMQRFEPPDDGGSSMRAFVEEKLTAARNRTMAMRALPLLEGGGVFIAVGALHLPGDDGLVELIRKAGYNLTPVN